MSTANSNTGLAWPHSGLDRRTALPAVVGEHKDFLFVTGLGNPSKEVAALTGDGGHFFGIGGAMGSACMVGLGLALAQPKKKVLVVTGDGEMLMSMGSLAVIGAMKPDNLGVIIVDNGHYGETGNQITHTGFGAVDLERVAAASGIANTMTVETEDGLKKGASFLRSAGWPLFILLKVRQGETNSIGRSLNPAYCRNRFRMALVGKP
jgi:thiamine pyrophosphate-dependent acetolactate synthase large subunit-like protein